VKQKVKSPRVCFLHYLKEVGWFFEQNIVESFIPCCEALENDGFAQDQRKKSLLHSVMSEISADQAAIWLAYVGGKNVRSDTIKSYRSALRTLCDQIGLSGKYNETCDAEEVTWTGNPFDSTPVGTALTNVKKKKIRLGEGPSKRAKALVWPDYMRAIRNTFPYRNLDLFPAGSIQGANAWNIAYSLHAVTLPTLMYALVQRGEFLKTINTRITPGHKLSPNPEEAELVFYSAGQKTNKEGEGQDKLLLHSGVGEDCFPAPAGEDRRVAWFKAGEDGKGPGICALCLYRRHQTLLDSLYKIEHCGQCRSDDSNAVIFPVMDRQQEKILWHQGAKDSTATDATQGLIRFANLTAPIQSNPLDYSGHGNKVGAIKGMIGRQFSPHDAQHASCHGVLQHVYRYGMEKDHFDGAMLLSELQKPPLAISHDIHSTRALWGRLMDAFEYLRQAKQDHQIELERRHAAAAAMDAQWSSRMQERDAVWQETVQRLRQMLSSTRAPTPFSVRLTLL